MILWIIIVSLRKLDFAADESRFWEIEIHTSRSLHWYGIHMALHMDTSARRAPKFLSYMVQVVYSGQMSPFT